MRKKYLAIIMVYAFLIIVAFISLFPFAFMFVSSTNSNVEILSIPPKLTIGSSLWVNFKNLNEKINLWRIAANSLFISLTFTFLALLLHSMAAYALAKYNFRWKSVFFAMIMLTMMLPQEVTYIPRFLLMSRLGWANSFQAVIFPPLANAFAIFLMRQNMLAFPTSLLDAASIDGCGEMQIFFKIVLPNIKPALGALGIYMFMNSWNSFMWPLIILSTSDMHTFPLALSILSGSYWRKDYGLIMLAASVAVLPIMAIFLVFQKQFIAGILGGAIKE
jgi:lactose/L-arabinose transport system permease protein